MTDNDRTSTITAPKMQVLLATLLIRANHVVSREALVNELWGSTPPRRATAALHVYVSQLRKLLNGAGHDGGSGHDQGPLLTKFPGYLLRVGPGESDLHFFQGLLHEGRGDVRAGRYDKAVTVLGSAFALPRGTALSGVSDGPVMGEFVKWLDEARIECAELFVESSMALGRYQEMTGLLRSLVVDYPLHETFSQQLILCLSRSGRRAEALTTYRVARETIRRELGLEPCRALRELHRTILRAEEEEPEPMGV
ncbi:BTAD domain-containing putative transcriptional regulator [Streptomyces sp. NPDC059080]|uniref:AfsR/SARP family transcriptional regulator n=1 Tax=Streptomyces sp. NPDC059080 TaxID=3346718 RepID=UPI0036CAF5C4